MSRRLVAVAAALLLALFGTVAMFKYVSHADERALAGQQAVTVLVAAKPIPAGTTLREAQSQGLLRSEKLPRKAVPTDALSAVQPGRGALMAGSTVAEGEVLTRSRFTDRPLSVSRLAVPEGQLAVTVEMKTPAHVGEFLVPGSEIAVFDTFNQGTSPDTPAGDHIQDRHEFVRTTHVLLPKVTVLAVDGRTASGNAGTTGGEGTEENQADQQMSADSTLVTVAISPKGAVKLVHAAQTGTIYAAILTDSSAVAPGLRVDDDNLFD